VDARSPVKPPALPVVLPLHDTVLAQVLEDLQKQLDLLLRLGQRTLVVDVSAVGQVSSTTVAALLWIKRRCSTHGVKVLLRDPSRRSLSTLGRLGLLRVLTVEPADDLGTSSRPS
jgi:anti-anti-sigma regulatory factor